jgi:hypothetical protein
MPPWAAARTTGMVRGLVVGERGAEQVLAPGGDEVDDDHHDQAVADQRQAHHPERAPDAGTVDVGVHQLVRDELEDRAHDQDADREAAAAPVDLIGLSQ